MSALWFIAFSLIWTGLLAGGAQVLSRDPVPAPFAHTIWRGAAFLSFLPWVIAGVYAAIPDPMATPIPDLPYIGGAAEVLATSPAAQAASDSSWMTWLGIALTASLIIGWLTRLGFNALCQVRLQNIKRTASPSPSIKADFWARQLGLKHAPTTASIPHGSPFLAGIRHRVIYLPDAISDQQDADIILAHECTHIARGDLITRPLERFVADVFWFSPFAWIMRRQLDYWREAACDAQTADLTGDNVAYARALAKTARVTRPHPTTALPVAAFILPRQETLKKRLVQLLERKGRTPKRGMAVFALAAALTLAPLSLAQVGVSVNNSLFSHAIVIHPKARVTSAYGVRKDPWSGKMKKHYGIDIGAEKHTYIFAPADAKVILSKSKGDYGETVDIYLEDGTKMRFSQMSKRLVNEGDKIKAGTKIGKMGMSGSATGPHLHLEVYKDGEHIDPQNVKGLKLYKS